MQARQQEKQNGLRPSDTHPTILAAQEQAIRANHGHIPTPLQLIEAADAQQQAIAAQQLAAQQAAAAAQVSSCRPSLCAPSLGKAFPSLRICRKGLRACTSAQVLHDMLSRGCMYRPLLRSPYLVLLGCLCACEPVYTTHWQVADVPNL